RLCEKTDVSSTHTRPSATCGQLTRKFSTMNVGPVMPGIHQRRKTATFRKRIVLTTTLDGGRRAGGGGLHGPGSKPAARKPRSRSGWSIGSFGESAGVTAGRDRGRSSGMQVRHRWAVAHG